MVHPFISIRLSCRSFPFLLRSAPKPVAVAAGKGGIGIAWDSIVSPGRLSAFPTVIVTGHHILPVSRCRCQRRHRYSARSGLLRIVAVVAVIGGRGIRLDRALLCISHCRCHRRRWHLAGLLLAVCPPHVRRSRCQRRRWHLAGLLLVSLSRSSVRVGYGAGGGAASLWHRRFALYWKGAACYWDS